ncbi:MAG: SPOR domain-containing protein, partial [Pseudomonadota bacterium]|nr:SPOR domain-containing protein [Pseudomonadota bacterium]
AQPPARPAATTPPPEPNADRAPEAPPRTAPTPPATTAATGGRVSAQIGAFNTRAQAQAALAARPGGSGTRIEEIQRNGTTLYRAIVTGFPDRAAAQSYCAGVAGGCVIR